MALYFDAAPNRTNFSFATEGLPAREELLLKSLIRLLDHRMRHCWSYQAHHADVWILGEGINARPAISKHALIRISSNPLAAENVLSIPFNAYLLEDMLNRLGDSLDLEKRAPILAAAQAQTVANSYRLIRWPPASLLGRAEYTRLSTFLLGASFTSGELSQRSGYAEVFCQEFINLLNSVSCLQVTHQTSIKTAPANLTATDSRYETFVKPLSVFARIRLRLTQPILGTKLGAKAH